MDKQIDPSMVHCNNCQYEGKVHASGAKQFSIFLLILLGSAYFLPLIVAALGYMVWILAQPPKRVCPKCKSTDLSPLTDKPQKPEVQSENEDPVA